MRTLLVTTLLASLLAAPAFAGKSKNSVDLSCGLEVPDLVSNLSEATPAPPITPLYIALPAAPTDQDFDTASANLGNAATHCPNEKNNREAYNTYSDAQSDCQKSKQKKIDNCVSVYNTWVESINPGVISADTAAWKRYIRFLRDEINDLTRNPGPQKRYDTINGHINGCRTAWANQLPTTVKNDPTTLTCPQKICKNPIPGNGYEHQPVVVCADQT